MVPEDKVTIILMLLADMLNTIFREITALATRNNEHQRDAAVGSVVLLCLLILIFLVVNVLLFLLSLCYADSSTQNCTAFSRRVIIVVVQTLGALLYIYGDNIGYILQNYSEELGCGTQCVINNRIAAVLTLGLALVILQLFPVAFKKVDVVIKDGIENTDWNDKTSPWIAGLDLITLFVKVDILYTTVAIMTQTSEFCGHTDKALSWTFIVFCSFVGLGYMVINTLYAYTKINYDKDKRLPSLIPSGIFLAFSLCMYLLADNEQPLDCGFGCDTFAANQTMNEISCNVEANSGLRLAFMLLATGTVATLAVIWIIIGIRTPQSEDVIDGTVEGEEGDSKDISLRDM